MANTRLSEEIHKLADRVDAALEYALSKTKDTSRLTETYVVNDGGDLFGPWEDESKAYDWMEANFPTAHVSTVYSPLSVETAVDNA